MIEAILSVSKKNLFICAEMKGLLSHSRESTENISAVHLLTRREIGIVDMIREGHSSREISKALHISLNTVETHRYNISKKLKVKNAVSLINYIRNNTAQV